MNPRLDFVRQIVADDIKTDKWQGRVATRFPPEPNGHLHIGHAKSICLNFGIAEEFGGTCNLRFDDTNPEKESQEYVDAIKKGLEWLGIEWSQESYTSDHMDEIYKIAEKLITEGKAYVSTADRDELSNSRTTSAPLPERSLAPEEQLDCWKKMLSGEYKQGEALVLFKGDLESQNTVMYDVGFVSQLTDNMILGISSYLQDVTNLPEIRGVPSLPYSYYQYANTGDRNVLGFELNVHKRFSKIFFCKIPKMSN